MILEAPPTLETARLTGRQVSDGDVAEVRHILTNPQCVRWLSPQGAAVSDARMALIVSRFTGHWKAHGFGVRLFYIRGGEAFAGWCGLRHQIVDGHSEIELLYALRHSLWGQGLGQEMAKAVVHEGLGVLNVQRVVALSLPDNTASQRVMQSCGLTYQNDVRFAGVLHRLFARSDT